jgi:hypothetical protein
VHRTIVAVLVAIAIAGCSDSKQQDLARCKLKAIELYRSPSDESKWSRQPLLYVHQCMIASGYLLNANEKECVRIASAVLLACWR